MEYEVWVNNKFVGVCKESERNAMVRQHLRETNAYATGNDISPKVEFKIILPSLELLQETIR
jgi:hypothetical protein